MFKNMKIEINDEQPIDEVVRELERLGFHCLALNLEEKWVACNFKTMIATTFKHEKTLPDYSFSLTTLAELKEM